MLLVQRGRSHFSLPEDAQINYYRFYPGDYQRDTRRLTLAEHGAYRLLLDEYYCTTEPLPNDIALLCKICGAVDEAERLAVKVVADKFFPVNGDGSRHNPRADRQIPVELKNIESAKEKGKLGAAARWGKMAEALPQAEAEALPKHCLPSPSPYPFPCAEAKIKRYCSEPVVPTAPDPAIVEIWMPTNKTGETFPVLKTKAEEWQATYPGVDVPQTLLEVRQWLADNPAKRKTARGMHSFIGRWMAREQNRG